MLTKQNITTELPLLRIKHALTKSKLALLSGVARETIWSIEEGKHKPTSFTVLKINKAIEELK